ncbi:MAG: MFS transporter [Deltaproteobacteria bacterium]|jgi:OPA family glycerol-3-phosphate transporter-like MFS transporter|nr:MFS transporter [Deltaproteobacteria bacterium]MBW2531823.1 MFS transporter [Deltaproteobacteria bacterium]
MSEPLTRKAKVWRVRILASTWLSYAGLYFCRKNFAIAKSSLLDSLDITKTELAHIFTAYLVAYMVGQYMTGFLGRKVATRILLLTGMAVSLGCNVVFGFSYLMGPAGYAPLMIFMVINGFAQASGWPGNVGILSNWLRRKERGRVMAIWATSYQLGSVLAKTFAAFMLGAFGAVWSFWGASMVLFGIWIIFFIFERDNPEDVGLDPIVEEVEVEVPADQAPDDRVRETGLFAGWTRNTILTVVTMGGCYFVFKFLRYALDSWSPLAIEELFGMEAAHAGYISTLFDWIGFLGVVVGGFASDRIFRGRRYQTVVIMTVGMFVAFILLTFVGVRSVWLFGAGLALCGFMLMGPDSLLSGVGAIDVGGRRGAVVAAGIINGTGSIGPIFQEEIIGRLLDRWGYQSAFYLMIGIAFAGILGTSYLASRSWRNLSTL